MKNEGSFGHNTVLVGDGGMNRVKKSFYDKRRSGLIKCQHEIYIHAKSGHSRMKNEGVMAKILFKCGGIGLRKDFIIGGI